MRQPIDIEDLLIWAIRSQQVEHAVDPHDDAVAVYWAVMGLPSPHRQLILHFARTASEPTWDVASGKVVELGRVRRARVAYREWIRAMEILCDSLAPTLDSFAVQGPHVDARPWESSRSA